MASELFSKLQATKDFLHREMVRHKTQGNGASLMTFREIGSRLDTIHEAERQGIKNLDELQARKLTRIINETERFWNVSPN
ncbi:MAG: hypothetical protein SF053_11470 [Bacteroidia bacterium]|jgi:hypothetical protein|nr:hypothetical protein [Bacteroidia bacterium]